MYYEYIIFSVRSNSFVIDDALPCATSHPWYQLLITNHNSTKSSVSYKEFIVSISFGFQLQRFSYLQRQISANARSTSLGSWRNTAFQEPSSPFSTVNMVSWTIKRMTLHARVTFCRWNGVCEVLFFFISYTLISQFNSFFSFLFCLNLSYYLRLFLSSLSLL